MHRAAGCLLPLCAYRVWALLEPGKSLGSIVRFFTSAQAEKVVERRSYPWRGFSLIELLAVVLILSILAAVAAPLYMNSRKTSAARSCLLNLTEITAAESAYALRRGGFTDNMNDLMNATERFAVPPICPLNGGDYAFALSGGALTLTCPNNDQHTSVMSAGVWVKVLPAPPQDAEP